MRKELTATGRTVVAEPAVEDGREHEALVEELADALLVGLDPDDAMLPERLRAVGQEPDRLEQVLDQDGLEHVELELAVRPGDGDGRVVADDLGGDHRQLCVQKEPPWSADGSADGGRRFNARPRIASG